jgi:hypothetical protein
MEMVVTAFPTASVAWRRDDRGRDRRCRGRFQGGNEDIEAEKARLVAEVEKVKPERDRVLRQVAKGNVSEDEADGLLAEIKSRQAALTAKAEHLDGLSLAPKVDREALREAITEELAAVLPAA